MEDLQNAKKHLKSKKAPEQEGWRYEYVKYAGADQVRVL